jgi:hypothetical protein
VHAFFTRKKNYRHLFRHTSGAYDDDAARWVLFSSTACISYERDFVSVGMSLVECRMHRCDLSSMNDSRVSLKRELSKIKKCDQDRNY